MDLRLFTDRYDLYRPTVSTTSSGTQRPAEPDTATSTDNPCLFFDGPGRAFGIGEAGLEQHFDARMRIPATQTLYAEHRGQHPDHVMVNGRMFVVGAVHDAAGRGKHKRVLLRERA